MKYPVWFPFPICWLRSLLVMIELKFAVLFGMLSFLITSLPAALTSMAHDSLFVFWMFVWAVVAPIYLFAQCDRFIWHRPKPPRNFFSWLPGWKSWIEGVFAYGGVLLAAAPPILLYSLAQDPYYYRRPTPEEIAWITVITFILLAYLYHLRLLFNRQLGTEITDLRERWARGEARYQRRFTGKKSTRTSPQRTTTKPPKPKPPADSIDAELEELRRRMEE